MDDDSESKLLQSLDSFWFFTNIFSCTRTEPISHLLEPTRDLCFGETEELSPESPKPISPIQQSESQIVENEPLEVMETPSPRAMPGEKRRARRGSKRMSRKIFGELDLGSFDVKEQACCCWSNWMVDDDDDHGGFSYGFSPRFGGQNLPPLDVSDAIAMKKHLKSWAYAVACTVK